MKVFVVVLVLVGYLVPIILIMSYRDGTYKSGLDVDNIIVLGAKIVNDQPSETLKSRLDKAILMAQRYPDSKIFVTGGQGSDELYFESTVMKQYLVTAGVENEIIEENQATSTYENFMYLGDMINGGDSNLVVTSNYHQYRANLLCNRVGLSCATMSSDHGSLRNFFYREPLAIYKSWLLDY